MKKLGTLKLVVFFTVLTVVLTWAVIFTYEQLLRQPFYTWVEGRFPDDKSFQDRIEQRVEHFCISTTVDVIVVTLLLGLVKNQQRKLRTGEERYRALFEHASDGIGVARSNDHRLVDVNLKFAGILGRENQRLIGQHVCDLFKADGDLSEHGLLAEAFDCCDEQNPLKLQSGVWSEAELSIKKPSGASLTLWASCSKLVAGKDSFFILIVRDLTEKKQLEAEKQTMEAKFARNEKIAALGRMAAQVAHEVKNPLAGLQLYSMHLKSKIGGKLPPEQESLVDKIIDGITKLSDTTERVLAFGRPISVSRHRADLNRLITDSLPLLDPQVTAKNIKVEFRPCDPAAYAYVDEAAMRSVFVNLALNAIDSTNQGGSLKIVNSICCGQLRMEITDTGRGMTDEQLKNLFEPFYTTKSQGLGLGMSFVAKVIELHNGRITVKSQVGGGTRITITLPAAEVAQTA
jgi:PAS domain S-box-containing protein